MPASRVRWRRTSSRGSPPVESVCGTPGRRCNLARDALSDCSLSATPNAACRAHPGPCRRRLKRPGSPSGPRRNRARCRSRTKPTGPHRGQARPPACRRRGSEPEAEDRWLRRSWSASARPRTVLAVEEARRIGEIGAPVEQCDVPGADSPRAAKGSFNLRRLRILRATEANKNRWKEVPPMFPDHHTSSGNRSVTHVFGLKQQQAVPI